VTGAVARGGLPAFRRGWSCGAKGVGAVGADLIWCCHSDSGSVGLRTRVEWANRQRVEGEGEIGIETVVIAAAGGGAVPKETLIALSGVDVFVPGSIGATALLCAQSVFPDLIAVRIDGGLPNPLARVSRIDVLVTDDWPAPLPGTPL
jgi:hypothetical protein